MDKGELAHRGLSAYRSGDFLSAMEFLAALTKEDPGLWQCRLYLAMSYYEVCQYGNALEEFREIAEQCSDGEIRRSAVAVLRELNAKSHQKLQTLRSRNQH